ncbi:unnamed protein product [Moneuplotes crassus]|uniref:Acyltransferase 3 domain-containing protein n=1 Tax=Euplotes crassus TaxID=5936 RepID=A0AAD2DC37_EUPCR|nr:unnamed protein product [Moneuplotes crassus]
MKGCGLLILFFLFFLRSLADPGAKEFDDARLKVIKKLTGYDPRQAFQPIPTGDGAEGESQCIEALRKALSPEGKDLLLNFYSLSGKSINQLGKLEKCRDLPETEYVILSVTITAPIMIGTCVPASCNSPSDFAGLQKYIDSKINQPDVPEEYWLRLDVSFPYQIPKNSAGTGTIITLVLIGIITMFGIVGSITQYIPFFRKPQSDPNGNPEKSLNNLGLVFYSFSFSNNLQKLFSLKNRGEKELRVFNGIRVFSICWVIVGHTFLYAAAAQNPNILTFRQMMNKWYFAIVPGGFFSVDVFFMMAGFLTFYLLTTKMEPKRGCINFPMVIFHRWFRLVIPAGFMILLGNFIFPFFADGPFNSFYWDLKCEKYWWSSILFVNNFVPWESDEMCMSWYWYLANDFQFFLISPLIIFIYLKNKAAGYSVTGALVLGTIITNMVITNHYKLGIFLAIDNPANFFDLIYFKPWNRFSTYGVGALFGFMYFEYKKDTKAKEKSEIEELRPSIGTKIIIAPKHSSFITYLYFLSGLLLVTFFVFIQTTWFRSQLNTNPWSNISCMLFNGFSRPLFSAGVFLIILPTFQNRLPWISSFLGSDFMVILGRTTFGVYLVHYTWIIAWFADARQGMWLTNLTSWMTILGIVPVAFLFAIPFSMFGEVPFMNLEKHFLIPKPPKKTEKLMKETSIDQEELKDEFETDGPEFNLKGPRFKTSIPGYRISKRTEVSENDSLMNNSSRFIKTHQE